MLMYIINKKLLLPLLLMAVKIFIPHIDNRKKRE